MAKLTEDQIPKDPIISKPEPGKEVKYPPPPPNVGDRFVKIEIYRVEGEGGSVPLGYGEYPRIERPRGIPVVIPEHYLACLNEKIVTFRHVFTQTPNPLDEGNLVREIPHTIVRFPYQNLGPATKEEWEEDQRRWPSRKGR